jgi:hypothetical protein
VDRVGDDGHAAAGTVAVADPNGGDASRGGGRVSPEPDWRVADAESLGFDPSVLEAVRGSTDDGQMAPGMPEEIYRALGLGNQIIAVSPSTGVVTVRLGTVNQPRDSAFTNADAARPAVEGLSAP